MFLRVPLATVPHLLPTPALCKGIIRFCKRLMMLTLPQDFLGAGAEMWPHSRFRQVVTWKTKLGGCSGHWWPAAVPAPACIGQDPLSPLWVPNPPSCPPERLRAGDKSGTELCHCDHHDPLWWRTPWARLFCCGYTHVHAYACMQPMLLRSWSCAASMRLTSNPCTSPWHAGGQGGVSNGTDAWLCLTSFYPVRKSVNAFAA